MSTLNDVRWLIRRILSERIRSDSGDKKTLKFKMNEFKNLSTLQECNDYADSRLKVLGWGSSRNVYLLSSIKVLKIAKMKSHTISGDAGAGMAQNQAEVEVSKNPRLKNVVVKVYDSDPIFKWIISDLVHQFDGDTQMARALKISEPPEKGMISRSLVDIEILIKRITKYDEGIDELMDYEPQDVEAFSEFIEGIRDLVDREDLHPGEFDSDHFGKTRDGRVVLYDYGGTRKVIRKFYYVAT